METKECKPKPVTYECIQGVMSTFCLTEEYTDIKADQTKVESTNNNKPEPEHIKSLTETPTDIKADQTKVESSNESNSEPSKHPKSKHGNTSKKNWTARIKSGTINEQERKQKFCIILKVLDLAAKQKPNVWVFIFVTFSAFATTYGEDLQFSIETSPIIFGKDATFKCSIESSNSTSFALLSTGWLKGKGNTKENIIYNNISTREEKYTPEIYLEADRYIYLMIIHNVSLSDLDTYTCEFDFNSATILFTMERNRPFIYFPGNNDIVYSISKTDMYDLIEKKHLQHYCIALYNYEDLTKSMIKVDNREATTYSTQLQMDSKECNGNLPCILGSMSFNLTKQIQQCSDGIESSTPKHEPTGMKTADIAILMSVIISIIVAMVVTVICVCYCKKRKYTDVPIL